MQLPLTWLHDFVVPDLELRDLAFRLAMTGTEVDRIHHHGVDAVEHFVVGKVLTAEPHPDADRLRVCTVDVGEGEPSQIVCGAPNVAAGQTVAVAKPGSVMPDGTQLKAAKLRGVVSAGMICAEDELGLGADHAGIMVLDDALVAGTPLLDVLPIATDVLELEITPNRPDCLGVYGVAREVAAATGAPLGPPPWATDPGSSGDVDPAVARVVVATEKCPRFTARAFEGVTIAPSPRWLKARLLAAGQRPINNVVDITNYVMLLTGQPLHAFDLDEVAGGVLTVRDARAGEVITTLDDVERTLDEDVVVIEDEQGPTSIAGVMGGQRSEVSDQTTRVLMEAATWDGPNVNRTMARLGLRSEAGARFEKGLAPEQAMEAQAVATALMLELTGATLVPGTIDLGGEGPPSAEIALPDARVERLLGAPVPRGESVRVLEALGFAVRDTGDGLAVSVPSFRRLDVTREADLVEEVARLSALETLPATLPVNRTGAAARLTPAQRGRRRAEDVLVGLGFSEVAGWSFTEPTVLDRLRLAADSPLRAVVVLENPMSEAQSILRPTIVVSLLDCAAHNVARGRADLALFESAAVYRADPSLGGLADEHHALAGLLHGAVAPKDWRGAEAPAADVFAAKGALEAVLRTLRVEATFAPAEWPFLHPGRSAEVLVDDARVGFVGEVHPTVAAAWDLPHAAAVFAVDLGKVLAAAPAVTTYADMTSFPAVRWDVSLKVPAAVTAEEVVAVARDGAGKLCRSVEVFDRFDRDVAQTGTYSIALHLEFAVGDRTLTQEEVAPRIEKVRRLAAERLGAQA